MRLLCVVLIYIFFPTYLLAQSPNNVQEILNSKIFIQTARNYYIKNTGLPKHFIKHYVNLTKSYKRHELLTAKKYKGNRSIDTAMANIQINKLKKTGSNVFYPLMQARLLWDYNKHLQKTSLESVVLNLRNVIDSAFFFFTLGLYQRDSLNEVLARKLVYVKSDGKGNELVDWERMNNFKVYHWDLKYFMEEPYQIDLTIKEIRNIYLPCFEKAIELDKKEFYYMIEMLLPFIRLGDEKTVQEKITQYKKNYSTTEQKWLTDRMKESIDREQKARESKKNNM